MTEEELREAGFERACEVTEVGTPLPTRVEIAGRGVLLCRDGDDAYFAVSEICPHESESMRFGVVFQGEITCPHHQYRFRLTDGRCNRRRCADLETFDIHRMGDDLWVRVP